jgi:putative ABC transport system permease protein
MVELQLSFRGRSGSGGSAHQFYYRKQQTGIFQDVSALRVELLNLTGSAEPQQVTAARVSAEFFHLFGAPIVRGRAFNSDEDRFGGQHVVVLSYGLWTTRFGRNPGVIGQTISLSGEPYVVVGIIGPRFNSEQFEQPPELYIPFQMDPNSTEGDCYCRVVGSLRPGLSLAMVNAQLKLVSENFRRAFPSLGPFQREFVVEPLRDAMVGDVRPLLMILLAL